MKKVLVIQTAFIGDVILCTSLIASIKNSNPSCEIDVLVRKGNEGLLTNNPHVRLVHTWDKTKNKISSVFTVVQSIRKEHYDLIINLQRFASSGIMTVLGGAKETRGFDKNPLSFLFTKKFNHQIDTANPTHEINRNFLLAADICEVLMRPSLHPSVKDVERISIYTHKNFICIAPASVWFTKQLPFEKWVELIQKYNALKPDNWIYILGGKGDKKLGDELISRSEISTITNLSGEMNFLESAALMKRAQMNYVNDSGPLHICSAMNAPVTAFFCSTTPNYGFGPLSDQSIIIESQGKLACKPCGLHGYKACPKGHFSCGNDIKLAIN
ncbi:MAG: glycosyltransferase family 9 protein [Bacteroidota bacterium]